MHKIFFVVEFLRNNDREQHSYVGGVYDDEVTALTEAFEHMKDRAGKYGAEIHGYEVNSCNRVYFRKLDCWDAFAECCSLLADEIRKLVPELGEPAKSKDEE